jgi:hypothetical protein
VDEHFTRDYGCTEAEWQRWLPDAVHGHAWRMPSPTNAVVELMPGALELRWRVLPPRRIALLNLPRLEVTFAFAGTAPAQRLAFLKTFDLHTQRGGG